MLLEIYNLETENDALATLSPGKHIIGRGELLKCHDKRISRNHAIINITSNSATITSTHINPCFFVAAGSKTVIILLKNTPQSLSTGDRFALLPELSWYKIKIRPESNNNQLNNDKTNEKIDNETDFTGATQIAESSPLKRFSDEYIDLEEASKKFKLVENDETSEVNINELVTQIDIKKNEMQNVETGEAESLEKSTDKNEIALKFDINKNELADINPKNPDNIETETGIINSNQTESTEENMNLKNEPTNAKNDETAANDQTGADPGPSTSGENDNNANRREKCWYGINCYRKNAAHKAEFSHPGDNDYDSDPNDSRPNCVYGATCYRKNRDHLRDYKHPPRLISKKKKRRKTRAQENLNETPEDNYDYDDPFIDDSGDEYVYESDYGDESEEESSQNVDENDEETKQLLKEAKQFMTK